MRQHIINSRESCLSLGKEIAGLYQKNGYLVVSTSIGYDHAAAQRKMRRTWYQEMAVQSGDTSAASWRAYCEAMHGIKIVSKNKEEAAMWSGIVSAFGYEALLKFIERYNVSVIGGFSEQEMDEYLESVYEFGLDQGYALTSPSKFKATAAEVVK